jgi:hypothetical protein
MSQQLTPINGGRSEVQTTISVFRPQVLSENTVRLRNLEPQRTEWIPEGRPIYRRLPSVSENYQIDFFEEKGKGYVYVPYGEGIFGPESMEVVASENKETIIIKPGTIVWEYGENPVNPVIINCRQVGLSSTRYLIGYQLYYDDAPFDAQYAVEDFFLAGLPLNITASTDSVIGWRYLPVNAFLQSGDLIWKSRDNLFPTYSQPSESWIAWETEKACALSKVVVRYSDLSPIAPGGTAKLSYRLNDEWFLASESFSKEDSQGKYFEFNLNDPTFQMGFKVEFPQDDISVKFITVSGILTLSSRPATLTTRSALVAYPENQIPNVFVNSDGEEVPLAICRLAYVDIGDDYLIQEIDDVREIIFKDYKPLAEWLTRPQDEDLIELYEEVSEYSTLWMSPTMALDMEYQDLNKASIQLSFSTEIGESA